MLILKALTHLSTTCSPTDAVCTCTLIAFLSLSYNNTLGHYDHY